MVTQAQRDELPKLVKCVENSHNYFQDNYKKYAEMMNLIFVSTVSEQEKAFNQETHRPNYEFNLLEQSISKLRGEFNKLEPSVLVTGSYGADTPSSTIEFIESHLRQILFEARKNGVQDKVLNQSIGGGFSVLKVRTDYEHERSMEENIFLDTVFYPTLCGFDPAAMESTKWDGEYCFENFPLSKEQFKRDYPEVDIKDLGFNRSYSTGNFRWSYRNDDQEYIMVCHLYKKEYRRYKLYRLANGQTMEKADYDHMVENWGIDDPEQAMAVPPVVINERWTKETWINRYEFIQNKLLDCKRTVFRSLPLIFVDGNSVNLTKPDNGQYKQITRSYIKNAIGAQKLKNLSGQTLANELINLIQHKLLIAQEALPDNEKFLGAYTNLQVADTLVYKYLYENDANKQLPAPQVVPRQPIPGEIINTFGLCDNLVQSVLGNYEMGVRPDSAQLSGKAIMEGNLQSNAAAMPYIMNYLTALTQCLNVISDMIPYLYLTPRTIPARSADGESYYVEINTMNGPSTQFETGALSVNVSAGASFAVQKSKSLDQMMKAMATYPAFGQLMNEKGLSVFIDNMECLQQQELKESAKDFMQKQEMQQQQAQSLAAQQAQQGMLNNPQMINAETQRMRLDHDIQSDQTKAMIDAAKVDVNKEKVDVDRMQVLAQMRSAETHNAVELAKADAERTRSAVDLAMATAKVDSVKDYDNKN